MCFSVSLRWSYHNVCACVYCKWLVFWSPTIVVWFWFGYLFYFKFYFICTKLVCLASTEKIKRKKLRVKRQTRVQRSREPWLIYTEYHLTFIPFFFPSSGTGYYRRRQNITSTSSSCAPSRRSSARTPIRIYVFIHTAHWYTQNPFGYILCLHTYTDVQCVLGFFRVSICQCTSGSRVRPTEFSHFPVLRWVNIVKYLNWFLVWVVQWLKDKFYLRKK